MNRDRAGPGPGPDGPQAAMCRDRAPAGPGAEPGQAVPSRDRAAGGADAAQTLVGPDGGADALDGGSAADHRLFSGALAGGRDAQAGENHSEPPPTNPVLVPPQQVEQLRGPRPWGEGHRLSIWRRDL